MKKFILIVILSCLCLGGGVEKEVASDELQPGPLNTGITNGVIL